MAVKIHGHIRLKIIDTLPVEPNGDSAVIPPAPRFTIEFQGAANFVVRASVSGQSSNTHPSSLQIKGQRISDSQALIFKLLIHHLINDD
ncbi:hypothetical protein [Paraburkholderia sp. J67]|uniref:hypothetical protein n=1 Tax=Paraburkholderia sp. J67 TaxID=2805435 RepID=UPI002ABE8E22|nr:hypothetical protein [Paraburkholderia sp. J67]